MSGAQRLGAGRSAPLTSDRVLAGPPPCQHTPGWERAAPLPAPSTSLGSTQDASALVAEAGGCRLQAGFTWGQACDLCEGQAEIVAVSATALLVSTLPTPSVQFLGLS